MKIKNVKVGVRVVAVTNGISEYGVLSGDTGTIVESDSTTPWVRWDAHTNADDDKEWALRIEDLRVLKPKHFPVGTKVVLVAEGSNVGVPVGTVGTVTIADGEIMPKVQYEGGARYWTHINQLGLVNE
jgi:hypothetical protein